MGRMREFYQCDIDVINVDHLPIHFDAEVAAICYEALASLDIGRVQLRVSNRKILQGYLEVQNIRDETLKRIITRALDRMEKEKVRAEDLWDFILSECKRNGFSDDKIKEFGDAHLMGSFMALAEKQYTSSHQLRGSLDVRLLENEIFREGVEELCTVLDNLSHLDEGSTVADLKIVRGLDYYTGTVYETQLLDVPEFTGSVCSGGRYDDLASSYINKKLPGVGISIGFTRLFDVMRQHGKLPEGAKSPAKVLVVLPEEEQRGAMNSVAQTLRGRGINTETAHGGKLKKQIAYAEKKGIPYIWFPADGQVKDMASGEQYDADAEKWLP